VLKNPVGTVLKEGEQPWTWQIDELAGAGGTKEDESNAADRKKLELTNDHLPMTTG
jgi:hypothetical protein